MPVAGLGTGRVDGSAGRWRELNHVFLEKSTFMINDDQVVALPAV